MNNLLIDIYKTNNLYSGLGQFSLNFTKELIKNIPENISFDFLKAPNSTIDLNYPKEKMVHTNFQKRYLPSFTKNYDIWHSLHQFPSHFPNSKTKQILTIHDLNFLVEKNEQKVSRYLSRLQKNIDKAHTITAISKYTKSQIKKNIDLKGKEVHVIYNGIARNILTKNEKPSFFTGDKFFFSIGILNKKKNFEVLLPIMEKFKDHKLVIAGNSNTEYGKEISNQIEKLGLSNQVILPGKISDNVKAWLYKNCEAFLFPSIAEGFGMPVIEAMREGKPVIISKHTSLPEIGGDKAFYFDNFEKEHMAEKIKKSIAFVETIKTEFSTDIKNYAEKFSWENSIRNYIKLYLEILNK
ncbi:glycosyltransferase family 4 protein [Seonamhaeicola maritimus]|uniref:glycosyltransferase family 4 protein n=1 Tax=Seonamhaeicola maritimus TaxID=2591822 RepID=UPI00249441A3|nr:glycosyltransferase family 1 protein [Seonamhaeicola maritimus]